MTRTNDSNAHLRYRSFSRGTYTATVPWGSTTLGRIGVITFLILATNVFTAFAANTSERAMSPSEVAQDSFGQTILSASLSDKFALNTSGWRVSVVQYVLGPFPIHAREQHFLSPAYPLNLSEKIDYSTRWPSSYADNGEVGWAKAVSENGHLAVSFPEIRWTSLRASEGWAALQHHTVLRTSVTVYPPTASDEEVEGAPHLLIDVKQGSFFTVLPSWDSSPSDRIDATPRWYAGNIYSMNAAPTQIVPLPTSPAIDQPTTYDLFISGDYEIRLFGDPTARHAQVPELLVDFVVDLENATEQLKLVPSHHVVPDFVDGWAFGQFIGIGLRSLGGWWTVERAILDDAEKEAMAIVLFRDCHIAPMQTKIITIVLRQTSVFFKSEINLKLSVTSSSSVTTTIPVKIHLTQSALWNETDATPIIATCLYEIASPTAFVAIPPVHSSTDPTVNQPPILNLHGAGVDLLGHALWDCAPPRHDRSWVIAPTGRTAWGLDWHGPSTKDAWNTVEALSNILSGHPAWFPWSFAGSSRVIVVGHSNGGQGTWYITSRYPDKVLSAVPAAAYMKSQAYVPLVQSRSAHFIDPALRAILESSLTPDDNDLFVTNLVDTPILAIHGGDDENVPVWHTRALVDTLKTWRRDADVQYQEDPHQPHCYSTVFDNAKVKTFINRTITQSQESTPNTKPWKFTLTVAIPSESDSLHGFRILNLEVPGRLGRLTVEERDGALHITSRNILAFSIPNDAGSLHSNDEEMLIGVDGQFLSITLDSPHESQKALFIVKKEGIWEVFRDAPGLVPQITGRMSLVLNSRAAILLVIPQRTNPTFLNAALRLSHNLNVYHKLDTDIIDAAEATLRLHRGLLSSTSNMVLLGGADNTFTRDSLALLKTPFQLQDGVLHLRNRPLDADSTALFLHPHPISTTALMLVMFTSDAAGLERALRLFPIRTGVTVPDWIILSPKTDTMGAGGVTAAGVWGVNWSWNEGMSSF
ncbi:hypothetical protein NM688_g3536 [Phlebia brevispora]|uniref:Uncharacterized protein n=1 Tax=Phlebia brevispora TaxID=194682 RepID=A0ACC1T5W0_9APHY|nr:hypothetical protein NM688_g3536 [Phlebia brevispora]